jgi:UDP-glucose 4-epimerase
MVLVTGGTGYIGSHTVVELIESGYEVVIADNLCNSKIEVLDYIKEITGVMPAFRQIDVCDEAALTQLFDDYKIDSVIHFAGLKAVGESVRKPIEYYTNNLVSTLVLCKVMREHGCKNIVFSSSATVYGDSENVPYTEDQPAGKTTNPYGETKVMQERILSDACVADDTLAVALLRYFNPLGSHASGLLGDDPNGIPNNLLPYVCRVATGELPVLTVYGSDYPTSDGTCIRDYIHVVDLAKGHIAALKYIENNKGVLKVNLGTGKGSTVLEVIDAYEKANDLKINYKIGDRRPGDIAVSYASTEKADKLLNWKAEKGLVEMCRDAHRYAVSHKK